jgi:hypothetical protein
VVKREQNAATVAELKGDAVEATFGRQARSYVLHPYVGSYKDHTHARP